ncbi:MAG: sel1 repeat family protein [Bdellovibrionales bacterium]|nr:sel1 repeat family protein [Bdellovibrionales bacterium]
MKVRLTSTLLTACFLLFYIEPLLSDNHQASQPLHEKARELANDGDFMSARKIWEDLASKGFVSAQYSLGRMYARGDGVARDFVKAHELFSAAANAGNIRAQYALSKMYMHGDGVTKDKKLSDLWHEVASKGGKDLYPIKNYFRSLQDKESERQYFLSVQEKVNSNIGTKAIYDSCKTMMSNQNNSLDMVMSALAVQGNHELKQGLESAFLAPMCLCTTLNIEKAGVSDERQRILVRRMKLGYLGEGSDRNLIVAAQLTCQKSDELEKLENGGEAHYKYILNSLSPERRREIDKSLDRFTTN